VTALSLSRPSAPGRMPTARVLRIGATLSLVVAVGVIAAMAPGFATARNLADVAEQSTVLALLAFGMTLVVIAGGPDVVRGGIDLSLGANLGLCDALYVAVSNAGCGDGVSALGAVGAGAAVGLVNAVAIIRFGVPPLLATLATMNACAGLELVVTQNTVLTTDSPLLGIVAGPGALGLSATDWTLVAMTAALLLVMHATPVGLRLRAAGAARPACRSRRWRPAPTSPPEPWPGLPRSSRPPDSPAVRPAPAISCSRWC
jgi:ribose transport system permease protein